MAAKYFKEAQNNNHYDARYFKENLHQNELYDTLVRISQAFSSYAIETGFKPILMHGSLIGWYWNKFPLPWDVDLDICIFQKDLQLMEKVKNYTFNSFDYLCDVNPHSKCRESKNDHYLQSNEENRIDARFICCSTGLFIDITALSSHKTSGYLYTKCPHFFKADDIIPLKKSVFSGVEYYIPNNVEKILKYEYGCRVFKPSFKDFSFNKESQTWTTVK